jgi:hypothetical protein
VRVGVFRPCGLCGKPIEVRLQPHLPGLHLADRIERRIGLALIQQSGAAHITDAVRHIRSRELQMIESCQDSFRFAASRSQQDALIVLADGRLRQNSRDLRIEDPLHGCRSLLRRPLLDGRTSSLEHARVRVADPFQLNPRTVGRRRQNGSMKAIAGRVKADDRAAFRNLAETKLAALIGNCLEALCSVAGLDDGDVRNGLPLAVDDGPANRA